MLSEALAATRRVGDVFDRLGVRWAVGGSLASSRRGIPRSTNDVDLIAELGLADVTGLVSSTESEFYVDEDAVRDAVRRRSCFNLIELKTAEDVILQKLRWFRITGETSERQWRALDGSLAKD